MRLIFSHEPLTWLVVALHGIDVGIDTGTYFGRGILLIQWEGVVINGALIIEPPLMIFHQA
jgi:serine acetyltransferase